MADSHEWIRNRAYALWEEEGRPHGKDAEHWTRACEEFETQASTTAKPAVTRAKKVGSPAQSAPTTEATPKSVKATSAKTKVPTAKAAAKTPAAKPGTEAKSIEPVAAPARKRSAKTPVA
ncbi:Protein of unknown function [Rhizobium sp. RU35A]|uniref:DUF2934 domain-containing protein n=1 Tax=Rhizobium sp. RU35A TaxID=1907414 RepID=UPI0009540035|nr:DUF2934 domain-containing protein [Rhizobium sp. RU35A]SIQ12291.1 Protein of unknown function [Rhizobium sp. RU35A]